MKGSFELARLICVLLLTFTHTRHNYSEGLTYFILEEIPKYGTLILSLISGYLYYSISRINKNLFQKKIRSLAIPFFIANISVLILVLLAYYLFNIDFLNRLGFDINLFIEGILSLNSPPINSPTFFVRDIFIIFVLIEVVINRKFNFLLLLIPLMIYGKLILRYEILFLFIIGVLIAKYLNNKNKISIIFSGLIIFLVLFYFEIIALKYLISILIFIAIVDFDLKFINVGGYTYLLHLYHSPIIVFIYPIINNYVANPIILVILQIILSIIIVYLFYLLTRRFSFLRILSGQR